MHVVTAPRFQEEVLVPFPPTLREEPNATHCRGTLMLASMAKIRQRGHWDRYVAALGPEHLQTIQSSVAGVWLPIEVGIAHYRACDSLDLPTEEILSLGGEVVHDLQRTFIGTVLKTASSGAGIGPLVGMQKFMSVYTRSIKGGGGRLLRIGPKDARVEFVGQPLSAIRYFRIAYRGFIHAGCEFFAKRVVVAELHAFGSATTVAYRLAWV